MKIRKIADLFTETFGGWSYCMMHTIWVGVKMTKMDDSENPKISKLKKMPQMVKIWRKIFLSPGVSLNWFFGLFVLIWWHPSDRHFHSLWSSEMIFEARRSSAQQFPSQQSSDQALQPQLIHIKVPTMISKNFWEDYPWNLWIQPIFFWMESGDKIWK